MKMLTPFQKAGYKPDDVFVVMESDLLGYYSEGDIAVVCIEYSKEYAPLFDNGKDTMYDHKAFIPIKYLQKIGKL